MAHQSNKAYFIQTQHLIVLTSKNNPIKEIRFRDVYPTSIGELQYDQQGGDVQYLTTSVTFNYRGYDFANVGVRQQL